MNIYEIDQAITALVDPETGEITDFEALESLSMAREEKLENVALWVKNLTAEAKAIRDEEKSLAERRRVSENKAESLKKYLMSALNGEKFSTPKVAVSFRKSAAVEIDEGFVEWAKTYASFALNYPEPIVDKTALRAAIAEGARFDLARVVERDNIQIK